MRPHEELRHLPLDLRQAELAVEAAGLADRLPGEEPDRRLARQLAAHEEHVEATVGAEDFAGRARSRAADRRRETPGSPG